MKMCCSVFTLLLHTSPDKLKKKYCSVDYIIFLLSILIILLFCWLLDREIYCASFFIFYFAFFSPFSFILHIFLSLFPYLQVSSLPLFIIVFILFLFLTLSFPCFSCPLLPLSLSPFSLIFTLASILCCVSDGFASECEPTSRAKQHHQKAGTHQRYSQLLPPINDQKN